MSTQAAFIEFSALMVFPFCVPLLQDHDCVFVNYPTFECLKGLCRERGRCWNNVQQSMWCVCLCVREGHEERLTTH